MARRRLMNEDSKASTTTAARVVTESTVTATEAQMHFGQIVDRALQNDVVVITRHSLPRAVLISFDRYTALIRSQAGTLDVLNAEFEQLLANMQQPTVRAAMHDAFSSSPEQLGRAAVAAATAGR